jgi:hypothetical protein
MRIRMLETAVLTTPNFSAISVMAMPRASIPTNADCSDSSVCSMALRFELCRELKKNRMKRLTTPCIKVYSVNRQWNDDRHFLWFSEKSAALHSKSFNIGLQEDLRKFIRREVRIMSGFT